MALHGDERASALQIGLRRLSWPALAAALTGRYAPGRRSLFVLGRAGDQGAGTRVAGDIEAALSSLPNLPKLEP
jgi:hypothetical protein